MYMNFFLKMNTMKILEKSISVMQVSKLIMQDLKVNPSKTTQSGNPYDPMQLMMKCLLNQNFFNYKPIVKLVSF